MQTAKYSKTRTLVECSILIAAATVLSFIKIYEAPLGGSVTLFSMVPIIVISFRHGVKWGLASGFVYSVIQALLGISVLAYVPTAVGIVISTLLDYTIAFTVIGLAGIFKNIKLTTSESANSYIGAMLGAFSVCVLRFISSYLSGVVVWYEITKNGDWNEYVHTVGAWLYSFVYNITYLGPETVLVLIAMAVIVRAGFIKQREKIKSYTF
ncbi:Thiamine transporter ThiT [bioreactor metagenome]|uniref:Thiamine transporter ThiT n=1 Tax=bioreactor metagenome TaxID=1076179 RepID=A0A645GLY6_9ZZZZ|nr:energy-coupled thiamine transporter ThiT [Oscillospiraceae bacterium]